MASLAGVLFLAVVVVLLGAIFWRILGGRRGKGRRGSERGGANAPHRDAVTDDRARRPLAARRRDRSGGRDEGDGDSDGGGGGGGGDGGGGD